MKIYIYHQTKLLKVLVLQLEHFVIGMKKVSCEEKKHHLTDLFIQNQIYNPYSALLMAICILLKKEKFAMLEYRLDTKKMIYKDKLLSYKKSSPIMKLFMILVQELIGNEKVLKPFWNNQCLEISQSLWLPTETDYVVSDMTLLNSSWKKMELNSHYVIKATSNHTNQNLPMMSCQLSMTTQCDNSEEEDIIRTRKIKIYPNKIQRTILNKWFGTTRYLYNHVLHKHLNDNENISSFQTLRNKFVTAKNNNIPEWQLETPKEVRTETLRDLSKAYKINLTNLKNKNISHFNFSYRKKKTIQSIVIPKTAIGLNNIEEKIKEKEDKENKPNKKEEKGKKTNKKGKKTNKNKENQIESKKDKLYIYSTLLKGDIKYSKRDFNKNKKMLFKKVQTKNKDNNNFCKLEKVEYDCRITKDNNNYYLLIPFKKPIINNNDNQTICSLDPGFRTFQTLYSNNEVKSYIYKKEKINKLLIKINTLKSLRDRKEIKRSRTNKKILKNENKIRNIINDSHHKISNDIINNYDHILLPRFENQNIQRNSKNKKLNKDINIYSHYTFKEMLKYKMQLYKNKKMYHPTEEYTSKTCTNCGDINALLGSSETFKCDNCNLKINRDINGARNIYIKAFI